MNQHQNHRSFQTENLKNRQILKSEQKFKLKMSCKLLVRLFVLVAIFTIGQSYVQELIIYENSDPDLSFHTFKRHLADLTICYNETAVICTKGFWVGYYDRDYEGKSTNIHAQNDSLYCIEAASSGFKSIRYGGDKETTKSALSVYFEEKYQGAETFVSGPANPALYGKSYLVTGFEPWTLYERYDFDPAGLILCVEFDPDYIQLGIYGQQNVTETLGLPQIGSALRGCDDKTRHQARAQYLESIQNHI